MRGHEEDDETLLHAQEPFPPPIVKDDGSELCEPCLIPLPWSARRRPSDETWCDPGLVFGMK